MPTDKDAFLVRAVPAHAIEKGDVVVTVSALGSERRTVFSVVDGDEEGICLNFTDADHLFLPIKDSLVLRVVQNEDAPYKPCARIMVGSGTDTYDPICDLSEGHDGVCKSTAAVDQHRLAAYPAGHPASRPTPSDEQGLRVAEWELLALIDAMPDGCAIRDLSCDPTLSDLLEAEESYLYAREREDRAREMADRVIEGAEFVTPETRRRMIQAGGPDGDIHD